MAQQRCWAALSVIADGLSASVAAHETGVSRQTVRAWLARYEAAGLDASVVDRSRRPIWFHESRDCSLPPSSTKEVAHLPFWRTS